MDVPKVSHRQTHGPAFKAKVPMQTIRGRKPFSGSPPTMLAAHPGVGLIKTYHPRPSCLLCSGLKS